MKTKKEAWRDDGRVIADMNVEGMQNVLLPPRKRRRFDAFGETAIKPGPVAMTKSERRSISRGVFCACLAASGIIILLSMAVMLFAAYVWF